MKISMSHDFEQPTNSATEAKFSGSAMLDRKWFKTDWMIISCDLGIFMESNISEILKE